MSSGDRGGDGDRHPPVPADPDEVAALVRDLGRLAREAPRELVARAASLSLRQQAEVVLRLPAKERLEFLLHAPQPMRLVRALPDAEVYLTVREVGPFDALPLLALASADQVQHLVDLEAWRGDRFDPDRAGAWVALYLEAGDPTLLRFLRHADDDLLALLFARWIRVRQIEIDDTPSIDGHGETEAGTEEGFLSPDGFHRFSPTIRGHAPAVRRIAEVLFQNDHERYERAVWAALWELPSQLEEQALHFRQSRLEEHGFPTWDEALSVYAPPAGTKARSEALPPSQPDALPAPRTAFRVLDGRNVLLHAVERLRGDARETVRMEITAVTNRLLVADGTDTGDTTAHRNALRRTASYISIALVARGAGDDEAAARILLEIPAIELFREGFARTGELGARARRLVKEGWPSVHPRALDLLDGPLRARLEGLLERRPLYFQFDLAADRQGAPYREFRSLEEIEETRVSLELVEVLGQMTRTLGWKPAEILNDLADSAEPPRFRTLFLTSLAWHDASGELRAGALTPDLAAAFLRAVASPEAARRILDAFVDHLAAAGALEERAASELAAFGRASLASLRDEATDAGAGHAMRALASLWVGSGPS